MNRRDADEFNAGLHGPAEERRAREEEKQEFLAVFLQLPAEKRRDVLVFGRQLLERHRTETKVRVN